MPTKKYIRRTKYPFDAMTETSICPDLVESNIYGQHESVVISNKRLWSFLYLDGRNRFETDVAAGKFRRSASRSSSQKGLS